LQGISISTLIGVSDTILLSLGSEISIYGESLLNVTFRFSKLICLPPSKDLWLVSLAVLAIRSVASFPLINTLPLSTLIEQIPLSGAVYSTPLTIIEFAFADTSACFFLKKGIFSS